MSPAAAAKELIASRQRIQAASDQRRQTIEKDLHAGAQQHLVALAVKLGLAEVLVHDDPESAQGLLRELRHDVQGAIGQLRDLAHRIYPALLRDRGLGEALESAARRSAKPCSVSIDLAGRYPADIETAVYFGCTEAIDGLNTRADVSSLAVAVTAGRAAGSVHFQVSGIRTSRAEPGRAVAGPPATSTMECGAEPRFATTHSASEPWFIAIEDRLCAAGGQVTIRRSREPGSAVAVVGQIPTAANV